jgi:alcohol dehydrogenase class IV
VTSTIDPPSAPQHLGNQLGALRLPQTILSGPGLRRTIGAVTADVARSVLICTDSRLEQAPELVEMVTDLRGAGVATHVYASSEAELPVESIVACVEAVRGTSVEAIIGFGGGSCIDLAKAAAVILAHGGEPQDYYGEGKVPGPTVQVIAVPTTAGTGSEATPVAVVSDPNFATKIGISSRHLIPAIALVDPELTHSCPPALTAAAGIDALAHLIEAFTATRRPASLTLTTERVFIGKSAFTDAVALSGMRLMSGNLVTVYTDAEDAEARAAVALGSLCGGVALATAGTAAAHALQYPLGALTHTPHGCGTGCLLPYVMRFNFPARIAEFGQIADALGVNVDGAETETAARLAVEEVDRIVEALDIPRTLKDLGVTEKDLPYLARQGLAAERLVTNNPRPLDAAALETIATAAFHGDRTFASA